MSQGPAEENPRLDEEVREAERRLANLTASSDDVLDDDALTDDDARAPDEAPSEGDPHQE
ncbi:hypothetical protein O7631_14920 [Micromonospora sp. WMMD967]|uniref:hypothetical protein n=1 Tax=Micromonospora sp. WMMD967 TaxID=3016101 RepID=UPI0024169B13|nr:hypothetical protein [Micromonospora sp. WMMD967]MDG4837811.1 hypothetical protein [Micromonospora sp. WMMD967]